jgi:polyisoprenoid-binding protein YceI
VSVAHIAPPTQSARSPLSDQLATRSAWHIDPAASRVEFTIRKRLFVAPLRVTGGFSDVRGVISLDEQDPTSAQADITIGASSIDTGNARRDSHLRQDDFFHVDSHPDITFRSRRIELSNPSASRYTVVGDLTVRGVTREVSLDTHYTAPHGSGDNRRMKVALTTTLNRRDFGLVWNRLFISVAGDLTVNLAIEATPAR